MKTIYKLLFAGLLCFITLAAAAQAPQQGSKPDAMAGATAPTECSGLPAPGEQPHKGCSMPGNMQAVDFQSVKICFAPQMDAFIAIDSVECTIHMVKMVEG